MIDFKCLDCKKKVLVFVDEKCLCGGTKIDKVEYTTFREWAAWWQDRGSKDRSLFYKSRKLK